MSESNEPSYYEIALTSRQVLVAFVLILAAVLGAFLCGVWVARDGDSLHAQEVADTAAAGDLDELEDFKFFSEDEKAQDGLKKPDLSRLMEETDKDSTLAEDVGSKPRKRQLSDEERERRRQRLLKKREEEQKKRENAERQAAQKAPKVAEKPQDTPKPAAPPPRLTKPRTPPPAAAATEGFIVQVFSTHDEPQAKKVHGQLVSGGFQAFISPLEKDGAAMYRVRIGPFAERAQADSAAQKVRKSFKLETWVTAASN